MSTVRCCSLLSVCRSDSCLVMFFLPSARRVIASSTPAPHSNAQVQSATSTDGNCARWTALCTDEKHARLCLNVQHQQAGVAVRPLSEQQVSYQRLQYTAQRRKALGSETAMTEHSAVPPESNAPQLAVMGGRMSGIRACTYGQPTLQVDDTGVTPDKGCTYQKQARCAGRYRSVRHVTCICTSYRQVTCIHTSYMCMYSLHAVKKKE